MTSSSTSPIASIISSRAASARSRSSLGDSLVGERGAHGVVGPHDEAHPDQVDDAREVVLQAFGIWMTTGWALRRSRICWTQRSGSAPTRSHLLMKAMRGTRYLSAWRHTVSDCGSTPPTAQKTATAPSSTRRLRSTSMVKSTWPGVSMMLMRWLAPEAGRRGGRDGDAALLLLLHPVHGRGPFVDLAHLVGDARVVEDALGGRGLPRIDVRHDPDVSGLRDGELTSHDSRVPFRRAGGYPPGEMPDPRPPGPSNGVEAGGRRRGVGARLEGSSEQDFRLAAQFTRSGWWPVPRWDPPYVVCSCAEAN